MFSEILTENQVKLLPLIKSFADDYFLVGGTAIALQLGHRYSIDFDLFSGKEIDTINIKKRIKKFNLEYKTRHSAFDQFHIDISDVRLTFFEYPYNIKAEVWFEKNCRMPDLLTLSAMKCMALGGRAKWKDYVDMYFILKEKFTLKEISEKASEIYGNDFNEKLLRQQLAYFKDIDYTEQVIFRPKYKANEDEIKNFLIEASLADF